MKAQKTRQNTWLKITAGAMLGTGIWFFWQPGPVIDPITTASVGDEKVPNTDAAQSQVETVNETAQITLLKAGLQALDDNDIEAVRETLQALDQNDVEYKILTWYLAISGNRQVRYSEIKAAQEQLKDWPRQERIQQNLERAASRSGWALAQSIIGIGSKKPKTFQSAFAAARPHALTGNNARIRELLAPYWHSEVLSAQDEKAVLETFGSALTKEDHSIRFFNMMTRDRITSAGRLAKLLNVEDLHAAWASVIRRNQNAARLIEKLDDKHKETFAYKFMQVEFHRRSGEDDAAIDVMADLPPSESAPINADAWWDERRIISRHKFEEGGAIAAYDLVAAHRGGSDETRVDAAFHAGWYALRGLNDAGLAAKHFRQIVDIAKGNISKARGYYWLGRALDGAAAEEAFANASRYSSTFYGQLASAALGRPLALQGLPVAAKNIGGLDVLKAADRLIEIGAFKRARALHIALGWHLTNPSEIRAIADYATLRGDHFAALKIAKAADWRGIDVGMLTHPTGAIKRSEHLSDHDHALALAVARQESEFNVAAISRANARGLLQLLPGTAREMARKQNLSYAPERLTTDAVYNAQLGTAYLNELIDRYDGSYVLAFAAYNAGPSRANEWVARFGDPRGKDVDAVIDWIEQIPFPETRSYVQRILENLQVYKKRLGQPASITKDLQAGRNTK